MDDVVHRTASWTTMTTTVATTTTVVTTMTNGPGTTKETAILLVDDDEPTVNVQTPPAKKKAKAKANGSFSCGSKKWVRIPDDQISAYDVSACRVCPHHPRSQTQVYSLAYFKHNEDGDYECPYGDCAGDVRFVCFMCRKLKV
jgi:hypothetical protein